MKRTLLLLVFLLASCIQVDNFSVYWGRGFEDACINAIVEKNYFDDPKPDNIPRLVRSMKIGNSSFLLVKNEAWQKGGNMIRYKIEYGDYVSYRLNDKKSEEFEKEFPDSGFIITDETVTIPKLSEDALDIVATIANDESYWEEVNHFPYNPFNNPNCKQ